MQLGEILSEKGGQIHAVLDDATLLDAADAMVRGEWAA